MTTALKATIQQAWATKVHTELDTGTDELGFAWSDQDGLHVQLGWNEHELEEIGVFADVGTAYETTVRELVHD